MTKYLSRKFIIVLLFTITAIIGLIGKLLSGGEFITLAGILVSAFTAGDVALNHIHRKNSELD